MMTTRLLSLPTSTLVGTTATKKNKPTEADDTIPYTYSVGDCITAKAAMQELNSALPMARRRVDLSP